ncbi:MAG: DUF547 domain-containing protein [Methylococcales bacterium]|jgi:hypothetical protein|nr:DUF547 domain-containing protein [Methylococcales bacterium]
MNVFDVVRVWFFLLLSGFSLSVFSAPTAELDAFWQSSDESSAQVVDHARWQTLLDRYLNSQHASGVNRFDYAKVTTADKTLLTSYLNHLQGLDPRTLNRAEQKAYWINLYNALTVKVILDHYPIKSITKLGGFFSFGPWDDEVASIVNHDLTLNDIEHHILRPIWKDNRIHYAVNCASIGCPNLSKYAYTASLTDNMLNQAASSYVNHARGASFKEGELIVSSIYNWYKVDFGGTDQSVIQHLLKYADADLKQQLEGYKGAVKDDYNWALNRP